MAAVRTHFKIICHNYLNHNLNINKCIPITHLNINFQTHLNIVGIGFFFKYKKFHLSFIDMMKKIVIELALSQKYA
jgi:hypothetical protein